jgi:Fic family protein
MLLELHRTIMDGLPARADAVGRLRREEEAGLVDEASPHEPPPAGELDRRLELMCAFANDQAPEPFIHPLLRAAILHFWLAHDRPFVDGNGRTARALFHWAMLRQGYAGFELLAVSAEVARAPDRYALAFRRTEGDDNDLTYFILHQTSAVQAADEALREEMKRTAEQLRQAAGKVRLFAELNPRQQALVAHALRRPGVDYVIAGHQRSHGVTHQTARDDLFDLVKRGLLSVTREGRTYRFHAAGVRSC